MIGQQAIWPIDPQVNDRVISNHPDFKGKKGTKAIQKAVGIRCIMNQHLVVAENLRYVFSDWEHDVLSMNHKNQVYEYEVKITRGDFINEQKKKFRKYTWYFHYHKGPNYFYFVCPENLIHLIEVPKQMGLIYATRKDGEVVLRTIRSAKDLRKGHDSFKDFNDMWKMFVLRAAQVYSQKHFLGNTLLTHKNKEKQERYEQRQREIKDLNRERP